MARHGRDEAVGAGDTGPSGLAGRIWSAPYLLVLVPPLMWSGNILLSRGLSETLPPVGLAFWRWVGAVAVLAPFVLPGLIAQRHLLRAHAGVILVAGLFGIAAYNTLVYQALQTTPALNATLIGSLMPLAIPLAARVILGDRIAPRQLAGIAISFLGVVWIVARGDPRTLAAFEITPGDLWMLAAVASWAIYSAVVRLKPAAMSPWVFMAATMTVGLVMLTPFLALEMAGGRSMPLTAVSVGVVAYVAVFASVLAYLCWNRTVGLIGPTRTGLAIHLMPVAVGGLAFVFLGEPIRSFHLAGAVLIATGIAVALTTPTEGRDASPARDTSGRGAGR